MYDLDRRDFLKSSALAGLMLGTGITPSLAQAAPKRGGSFILATSGGATSDTIDPATFAAGPVIHAMLGGVCNNLVEIDHKGFPVGELAESWDVSKDAKTWTFKLRKGVTFSNGKALTPSDVIASFNHHRGEDTKSGAKGLLKQIVDIKADGNNVVFELEAGNADFNFVTADYHLIIMPDNGMGKIDWTSAIGTGGYVLSSHDPGVSILLKRRDDYWKSGRAWFDEVKILTINDTTARQNALVTGEVDAINGVDLKTINLLQRRPNINIIETSATAHFTMPMFTDVAPFNDLNVRLAIKYAVDREAMLQKILRGHGRVGNDHPIAPANRFFAADLPQRPYDPDRAKYHLKKAGMDSLDIELSTSDAAFNGAVDAAILLKESAKSSGININVKREPIDGYWSNVWLQKPFSVSYWNGRPTEDWMFSLVYAAGAEWNESHWNNEKFNKLLIQARAEINDNKRRDMYYEMQQICSDDGGTLIPMFANYLDAANDKIGHANVAGNRFLDGWKSVERWWRI